MALSGRAPATSCACQLTPSSDSTRRLTAAMLDVTVAPAQYVGFERRENGFAVVFEDERLRLVQPVHDGLAKGTTKRPPHQPLNLDRPCRPGVEAGTQMRVKLVSAHPQPLERRRRQPPRGVRTQQACRGAHEVLWRALTELCQERADITLGRLETDGDEHGGRFATLLAERGQLLAEIGRVGSSMRACVVVLETVKFELRLPAARDPQDLDVSLERFNGRQERAKTLALACLGQRRIAMRLEREYSPRPARAVNAVAVDEVDRPPPGAQLLRTSSTAPAASSRTTARSSTPAVGVNAHVDSPQRGPLRSQMRPLTITAPGPR